MFWRLLRVSIVLFIVPANSLSAGLDEIVIDPEVRLHDYFRNTLSVGIVQRGDRLHFFLGKEKAEGTRRYERDLLGNEVRMSWTRTYDSGYDYHWDDDGLLAIEIDGTNIRLARYSATGSNSSPSVVRDLDILRNWNDQWFMFPSVERIGETYLAAWLTDRLRLVRYDTGMGEIGEDSWPADPSVPFALERNGDGGILAWSQNSGQLAYLLLDGEGIPRQEQPFLVQLPDAPRQVAAVAFGNGWRIAYATEGEVHVFELDGSGNALGTSPALEQNARLGLALANDDQGTMVCCRDESGNVYAAFIDETLEFRPETHLGQGTFLGQEIDYGGSGKCVDVHWTGEYFVALWNEYDAGGVGPPCEWSGISQFVQAQWFGQDGAQLHSSPIHLNKVYSPARIRSHFDGKRFRALMNDATSLGYQVVRIDPEDGEYYLSEARAIVRDESRCDTSFWHRTATPAGDDLLIAYTVSSESWHYGWYYEDHELVRLTPDGSWIRLLSKQAEDRLRSVSIDGDAQAAWMGLSFEPYGEPSRCELAFDYGNDAHADLEWSIAGNSPSQMTVAGKSDRAKVVWHDDRHGHRGFWHADVPPMKTGDPIEGEPLFPDHIESVSRLRLIDIESQTLLVYAVRNGTREDVYWARFDAAGTILDETPHFLADIPRGGFDVAFDGYNYVIAWSTDHSMEALRLSRRGEVLDRSPQVIADVGAEEIDLSSDGSGTIGIAYDGNKFRTFEDDLSPILLSNLTATLVPEGVIISWEFHVEEWATTRLLRSVAGDGLEPVSIPVDLRPGRNEVLDRVSDRTKSYEYILELDAGGSTLRFGPVTAEPGSADPDLSLEIYPNPPQGDQVRMELGLPAVRSENAESVELSIFDSIGRRIHSESLRDLPPGRHTVTWRPSGSRSPAGIYYVQLRWYGRTISKSISILSRQ